MTKSRKAHWQLPPGVSRGTWDYLQSDAIAQQYDDYFADSALMRLDLQILEQAVPPLREPPPLVADLGCGTGRVARRLLPLGYRLLNIDLSPAMLNELQSRLPADWSSRSQCLRANLVELDTTLEPDSIDFACCLFSSIGMIRGAANRDRFVRGVFRALKPDGGFLLHVHNRYHRQLDPGTPRWLLRSWLESRRRHDRDFGDRQYVYRGLPAMYLHIYSRRELATQLRQAGFRLQRLDAISSTGERVMGAGMKAFTAGGYFALAAKPAS